MTRLSFERWMDNQPLREAAEKFSAEAESFLAVKNSSNTEDRIAARTHWQSLSAQYWDVLAALVDAQAEGSPEELRFDRQERLFIDFGYVDDDLTPASSEIKEILNPRISPGLFQYYHFSDFIAEAYAMIMEKPVTPPLSGFSLEGKVTEMDRQLDALTGRIKIIMPVALTSQGALPFEAESLLSDLCDNIKPYTETAMRTRKYREAPEKERQEMAVRHRAFTEAEKRIAVLLKAGDEENGEEEETKRLDEQEAAKLLGLIESAKSLARSMIFADLEIPKWERRIRKVAEEQEGIPPAVRRRRLRALLFSKKEYISFTAKSARRDPSQLCMTEQPPLSLDKAAAIVEEMASLDPDMLVVARVRMYGIPRVILVPGQGFGTYDWSDHTLLLPAFPINNLPDRAAAYALGTFRWDSDEDRIIKNGYELIRENRKKSILELGTSFNKDYHLWLTKEKKGYRILPRNTHKVFIQIFAPATPD